jgi:hypothetical protein
MTLTCTTCAAPAMAVRPGTAPETCEIGGKTVVLTAGERCEAWCWEHWRREFARDLFAFAGASA